MQQLAFHALILALDASARTRRESQFLLASEFLFISVHFLGAIHHDQTF